MASGDVKPGSENHFADFIIRWDKELSKQEASTVVEAARNLMPVFNEAREFVQRLNEKKVRAWVRVGYPYMDPFLNFEIWYDEVAKGYGIHVFENLSWNCYGSIHFRHEENWI